MVLPLIHGGATSVPLTSTSGQRKLRFPEPSHASGLYPIDCAVHPVWPSAFSYFTGNMDLVTAYHSPTASRAVRFVDADLRGGAVPPTGHEAKVLSSWKEIATYLSKGVRTVQRWEHEFGLPVSRPKKARKGVVLSSTDKLDRWLAANWAQQPSRKERHPNTESPSAVAASIRDFRRLRQTNRELVHDLTRAMEGLRGESQALARAVSRSSEAESRTNEKPQCQTGQRVIPGQ